MSDPTMTSQDTNAPERSESRPSLDAIFAPRAVAVIGATEKAGSVGRSILWNLISSPFGGTVYPVNPKRPNVLGIRSYPHDRRGARAGRPRGGGDPRADVSPA